MDFITRLKKALEHPGTKPGQRQRNQPQKAAFVRPGKPKL